ncbi:metallophosphoesterase [Luteolibacter sp. LG18]|nr:metallophosphoesterase [Luteolibacter sp. LG18]
MAAADALGVEPDWIEISHLDLSHLGAGKTIVHLTDLHYRGDRAEMEGWLRLAREQKPDYLFVTGDVIDRNPRRHLAPALEILSNAGVPVYGVIGNHDPVGTKAMAAFRQAAAATGGKWLYDESVDFGPFVLQGTADLRVMKPLNAKPHLLLCHYPAVGDKQRSKPYELILAGHSHGGQCRVPGFGAIFLPDGVGRYVQGLFETPVGKLFVSRGLGTTGLPIRFACRPEMTVIRV